MAQWNWNIVFTWTYPFFSHNNIILNSHSPPSSRWSTRWKEPLFCRITPEKRTIFLFFLCILMRNTHRGRLIAIRTSVMYNLLMLCLFPFSFLCSFSDAIALSLTDPPHPMQLLIPPFISLNHSISYSVPANLWFSIYSHSLHTPQTSIPTPFPPLPAEFEFSILVQI